MASMSTIGRSHGRFDDSERKSVLDDPNFDTSESFTPLAAGGGPAFAAPAGAGDPPAAASFASVPTLADYLINGYWAWSGYQGTGARHWDHNNLTVNIQDLTAAEQTIAITVLGLWHDVANVNFSFTTGAADITYINDGSGSAVTSYSVSGGNMSNATVHISSDWSGGAASGNYSYFFQTYVHETGHALGLGHQGAYNGSGTYGTDNVYTNDTWRWSVMSYFSQDNYSPDTYDNVITPEMADIYAVQSIYGAQSTRTGDTTYGFNSTAGSFYNFSTYSGTPAFTIYDTGGNDTFDASGYSNNQTIDLTPGDWSSIGGYTDNIGIYLTTTIENAIGGSGNDIIYGNDANNNLTGNAGDDTMKGGGGADFLSGGDGNDSLNGGDGNDTLYGGNGDDSLKGAGGADYLYGGAGNDTATYDQSTTAINANLSTGVGQFGDAAGDTYVSIENLFGTRSNDTLIGNSDANALTGDDGDDLIQGFLGNDTMNGGNGTDTLSYDLDRGVTISLAVTGPQNTGGSGTDTVSNFENLTGSYFNDTLSGDDNANTINGTGGSDTINGLGGNDTIFAGAPNTYIVKPQSQHNSSIASAVSLNGSFVETYSPIIQNSTTTPHATVLATASGGFEYYSFTVTAGAHAVFDIDQTIGVDTYLELFGTDGTTLLTTADDSTVDPGSGTSLDSNLSYTFATAGTYYLRVDRYAGGVGPVAGAQYTLNVSLDNAPLANPTAGSTLNGGSGVDTVYGSSGNDHFIDDDGVSLDTYYAGAGVDTIDYTPVTFADGVVSINLSLQQTVVTGGNTETISGFENVEGSQGGELLILGNSLANVLDGNGGNDTIDGFFGNDTMNGGAGVDTLSYALDLGATVNLGVAGAQNTGADGVDTVAGFENLTGSYFNDTLTGNAGNNVIRGGGGADHLNGGDGNDTLYSGATNRTIVKPQAQSNSSIASAVNLDGHFGLQDSAFIANATTIPHATVTAKASGNFEYYSFSVAAGATATFDIDQTSIGQDTYLRLFSTDGTTLLTSSDDSPIDPGSDNVFDSNLTYTFAGGGVYYLRVDRYPGDVAPTAGSTYTLSVSLDTAIVTPVGGGSQLAGGNGNDTYYVYNPGDTVIEAAGGGTDTVISGISWTLADNVENLTLTGVGNINGTGNALANTLLGNTGNNILDGKAGADIMKGGAGNDTYVVDNAGDVVTELAGQGTDTVQAGITYTLGNNIENLTLTGVGNIKGTGNGLANHVDGNAGNNVIDGMLGNDILSGGGGHNAFLFDTSLTSNVDTIVDFTAANDTIRLDKSVFTAFTTTGTLAAGAFDLGTAASDADDRIIYNMATGNLFYDKDGTGAAAAVEFAHLNGNPALSNTNFLVVA
jgi:Ca2+-binding RTX toxin-like protein